MDDLTLVIPAKNESESLPKVLSELIDYNIKKIVVIPPNDLKTREAIKNFDCKILSQTGVGFGNALIQGINSVGNIECRFRFKKFFLSFKSKKIFFT